MSRTNPLNESERAIVRAEVARAARAIRSYELPFLEGVHKLAALRFEVSEDRNETGFMLFVAIAAEADHIPNSEARALCAESWLAKCDRGTKELEELYGERVVVACNQLIERFSREA